MKPLCAYVRWHGFEILVNLKTTRFGQLSIERCNRSQTVFKFSSSMFLSRWLRIRICQLERSGSTNCVRTKSSEWLASVDLWLTRNSCRVLGSYVNALSLVGYFHCVGNFFSSVAEHTLAVSLWLMQLMEEKRQVASSQKSEVHHISVSTNWRTNCVRQRSKQCHLNHWMSRCLMWITWKRCQLVGWVQIVHNVTSNLYLSTIFTTKVSKHFKPIAIIIKNISTVISIFKTSLN